MCVCEIQYIATSFSSEECVNKKEKNGFDVLKDNEKINRGDLRSFKRYSKRYGNTL